MTARQLTDDGREVLGWAPSLDRWGGCGRAHLVLADEGRSQLACGSRVLHGGQVEPSPPTYAAGVCARCQRYHDRHLLPIPAAPASRPASD